MIIDAGPLISEAKNPQSKLWALVLRAVERGQEIHTTNPVLAQVWRDPVRQANLARLVRHFTIHSMSESVSVGRKLAESATSDVVDAHLACVAERLDEFVVTSDPGDMEKLGVRHVTY